MLWLAVSAVLGVSAYDQVSLPTHYDSLAQIAAGSYDQPLGETTLFYEALDKNGLPVSGATPPTGATAKVVWDARDPLVNQTTGGALSWTGSAASAVATPLCPSGDWSDLDSTDCMQALDFDGGTAGYLTTDDNVSFTGGDIFAFAIYRINPGAAGTDVLWDTRTSTSGQEGVLMSSVNGSAGCQAIVYSQTAGAGINRNYTNSGEWEVCIVRVTGTTNYLESSSTAAASSAAHPAGTYGAYSRPVTIGIIAGGSASYALDAQLAHLEIYEVDTPTAAMSTALLTQIMGIEPIRGIYPDVRTMAGPTCYWYINKLQCFADDWIPMGNEIPPALTAAGTDCNGLFNTRGWTNELLYTADMTAGSWVEVGTAVLTTTTTNTPFASGAVVNRLTDNDGAATERVYATITPSAHATSTKLTFAIWAGGVSGAQGVDVRVKEETGGTCTTPITDLASQDIAAASAGGSWLTFTHTWVDGNCTDATISFGGVSSSAKDMITDTSDTSDILILPQLFVGESDTPQIFVPTTSAAATGGRTNIEWNDTLSQLAVLSGPTYQVTWDYTPMVWPQFATSTPTGYAWWLAQGGTGTAYYFFSRSTSTKAASLDDYAGAGASFTPSFNATLTAGTTYAYKITANYAVPAAYVLRDGTQTASDLTAPNGAPGANLDSLFLGGVNAASATPSTGFTAACISNVRAIKR